jgi:ABC-type transport system substrate-binding protein
MTSCILDYPGGRLWLAPRSKCALQSSTLGQLTVGIALTALMVLAAALPSEAQVRRLVFASAGTNESNRFWIIARPQHLQYEPFLETLLDVDPETGAYTPRLAEKWEATPDMKEWTFYIDCLSGAQGVYSP